MAPKKKDDGPKERPLLGRFKSNLKARAAIGAPGLIERPPPRTRRAPRAPRSAAPDGVATSRRAALHAAPPARERRRAPARARRRRTAPLRRRRRLHTAFVLC